MLTRYLKFISTLFTPRRWQIFRRVVLSVLIILFLLLWFANQVISHERQYTYDDVEKVPYNKVAVVLGTSKYLTSGGLNQYFQNRIDATVALWFSGKIKQIIVSGDNAHMSYNEPREMRRELLKRGIPASAIYSDYAGFRTLDSILRAHGVFGLECMIRIAEAIGLDVERDYIARGRRRGETIGWFITEKEQA